MYEKILIGVIVIILASLSTLYAGLPSAVEQNTKYRLDRQKSDTEILKTLTRIEANQKILLQEYHRNVSQ